jgi:hypothetical protein
MGPQGGASTNIHSLETSGVDFGTCHRRIGAGQAIQYIYSAWFLLELLARIAVDGRKLFVGEDCQRQSFRVSKNAGTPKSSKLIQF